MLKRIRNCFGALFAITLMGMLAFSGRETVKATENVNQTASELARMDFELLRLSDIENETITVSWDYTFTKAIENNYAVSSFELQLAEDKDFTQLLASQIIDVNSSVDTGEIRSYQVPFAASILGENGKTVYTRIRACGQGFSSDYVSFICWEGRELYGNDVFKLDQNHFDYWKINEVNFPGLCDLLKEGYCGYEENGVKRYYDANRDGWLSPDEVIEITMLDNYEYTKTKSGTYDREYKDGKAQCKLSSVAGIEKLPCSIYVYLRSYTGSTIDLKNAPWVNELTVKDIYSKKISVNAPATRYISVSSSYSNNWKKAKLTSVDISECTGLVRFWISGDIKKKVSVKYPKKAPELRDVYIGYTKNKTINLNRYKALLVVDIDKNDVNNIKVDKCTNIRIIELSDCKNVKSLNVKNAKKLFAGDITNCDKLKLSKVKKSKNAKFTVQDPFWWEYKKKTEEAKAVHDEVIRNLNIGQGKVNN